MTHETAAVKCECDEATCPCCEACVCKGNAPKETAVMDEFSMRETGKL